MKKVININEKRTCYFVVSEVICAMCLSRWIAARPEETQLKTIECKNCGDGYVIETGGNIYD